MTLWNEISSRFTYLFRRSRFDREFDEEIASHLEARADELEQQGLARAAALAEARREFGSTLRASEDTRSAWQLRWVEDLFADLRYAARAFRRNPAFSLTAISCLALGIGANTTMFSVAMEVLFSEPSCRDPQSLVQIRVGGSPFVPLPQVRFIRDAKTFDGLAGMNIGMVVNWRAGGASYRVAGTHVTGNFFDVTGVPVAIGRPIQAGDSHAAVLTNGFWKRRLGGDANIIGRKLLLDGEAYTVVGVLPRDHRNLAGFGFMPDLYMSKDASDFLLYARLPEGMSHQAALSRLEAVGAELDRVYPNPNQKWSKDVDVLGVGGTERFRAQGGVMPVGLTPVVAFAGLLILVTGLVLLIACANVSSLLLARAFSRSRELAIRASLGGSRARILRQLFAETLLLVACGSAAGLALNVWLTRLLSSRPLPVAIPIEFLIQPDRRLLAYTSGIAILATLAAGLAPALRGTRACVGAALKSDAPQAAGARSRLRNALVAGQLAVSIILLSGALLFLRNLRQATSLDPGFDAVHTVWATFRTVPDSASARAFGRTTELAQERLRALPGVESAAVARAVPMAMPIRVGGEILPDTADRPIRAQYNLNAVGPDYFRTMQIPILRGRAFLKSDRADAPRVVILNENMRKLLFGNADPIGRVLRLPDHTAPTVVGVARNSRYFVLGEDKPLAVYKPFAQYPDAGFAHFLVRAVGPPESIVRGVDRVLAGLDTTAAVETRTVRDALQFTLLPSRVGAGVLGATALLGLTLASIGLYGVLLYAVSRRIREIGVRVALGATPLAILRMVAGESARLVAAGLSIGLALAFFAVRPLSMFLVPGVRPSDPMNFVVVAVTLGAVAALATVSPALRALRIDPAIALRHE